MLDAGGELQLYDGGVPEAQDCLMELGQDNESRAEEREMFVLLSVMYHLRFLIIVLYIIVLIIC